MILRLLLIIIACLLLVLLADKEAASADGTPKVDVTIADCGVL
jgi:hypothetical protein